jgi:hypothetical protein
VTNSTLGKEFEVQTRNFLAWILRAKRKLNKISFILITIRLTKMLEA